MFVPGRRADKAQVPPLMGMLPSTGKPVALRQIATGRPRPAQSVLRPQPRAATLEDGAAEETVELETGVTVEVRIADEEVVTTGPDEVMTGTDEVTTGTDELTSGTDEVTMGTVEVTTGTDVEITAIEEELTTDEDTVTVLERVPGGGGSICPLVMIENDEVLLERVDVTPIVTVSVV
jgi:hypothetical protein